MVRVEHMLVGVLIALALLLGIVFGGSSIWFLKPSSQGRVVDNGVTKYVCFEGSVRDRQEDCPRAAIGNGSAAVVCPSCPARNGSQVVYQSKCDCAQCSLQCGGIVVTSTTLHVPVCKPCTANPECGQQFYGDELRCRNGQEFRLNNEPLCEKGCCQVKQTQVDTRKCTEAEVCSPTKGCIPIPPDEPGDET